MLWAEGEAPGARCAGALQERGWKDKKEKKRRMVKTQRKEGQRRSGHEEEERSAKHFLRATKGLKVR